MDAHDARPAAVLWDMDGTLIDSEPYWMAAEGELAARFGVEWSFEEGMSLVGKPLDVSGQILRDRGVDMPVDQIVDYLLTRVVAQVNTTMPWQEDATALLREVVAAGIPCALVTMSYAELAEAMTSQLPGVFSVVVTGDTVTHGKPHPEPYLTAAKLLGVDITRCVAIEDSPTGAQSALASGAATLAVRRFAPLPPQAGLSRVDSLAGLGVDALASIAAGKVLDLLGAAA